ncbi:lysozyme inhibitor LprI family protein [Thiofilum flexile]|uniref:lysozyme inhibitor LprI family protein n=1 Tax=Thiofilum flexile TaxID=125627 RepID=UPI00037E489F|nr:lysozyme inhibitor LprI family protein [Thiofilum flexile]
MKKAILIAVMTLFSTNAFAAAECSQESLADLRAMTPEQAGVCASSTEADLTKKYESLLVKFKGAGNGLEDTLKSSQTSWIDMRDRNCSIVNQAIPTDPTYGTNAIRARNICNIIMNTQRSDFLSLYL